MTVVTSGVLGLTACSGGEPADGVAHPSTTASDGTSTPGEPSPSSSNPTPTQALPVADTVSKQDLDADGDPRTMSFLLQSTGLVATVTVPEGFTHAVREDFPDEVVARAAQVWPWIAVSVGRSRTSVRRDLPATTEALRSAYRVAGSIGPASYVRVGPAMVGRFVITHPLSPSNDAYRALLAVTRLGQDYLTVEYIHEPQAFSLTRAREVTTSVLHSARVWLPQPGASTEPASP
jgi:hypothetical protein